MGKRSVKERRAGGRGALAPAARPRRARIAPDEVPKPPRWLTCLCVPFYRCSALPTEVMLLVPLALVSPWGTWHIMGMYITPDPFWRACAAMVAGACNILPYAIVIFTDWSSPPPLTPAQQKVSDERVAEQIQGWRDEEDERRLEMQKDAAKYGLDYNPRITEEQRESFNKPFDWTRD